MWTSPSVSCHVVGALGGRDEPAGRAHREHLDEREARRRASCVSNARLNIFCVRATAPALCTEPRATYAAPCELRDEVADQDRVAVVLGVAAVERVLGALADHGRRGHVAAGLAEHAVVQQDAGDVLAARRGVEHLLQAFVHHVAVALQREHERVGEHALHAGRDRRRAAVQRLHEVDVHRARERRVAADAGDRDRARRRRRARRSPRGTARTASGSPQPGHMWCSWVSSRSGFSASTMRAPTRARSTCR